MEAYNCSVLNGFPNMFVMLGHNAATGPHAGGAAGPRVELGVPELVREGRW